MSEFEVGQLAQELFTGYFAYAGLTTLMRRPDAMDLVERMEAENTGPTVVPIESIVRKDGTAHWFSLSHALREILQRSEYQEAHDRLWLGGALLTVGDALARERYFDHGPDLEFVRHLRNGVGHGNRFHFETGAPYRPAWFTSGGGQTFEITAALQDQPVLFDFVGPGDVVDLLQFISVGLIRIGNGDPVHHIFEQNHP